ncbi:MAG: hypothetical protein RLZZ118_2278 [Bacteroidota bacterium]
MGRNAISKIFILFLQTIINTAASACWLLLGTLGIAIYLYGFNTMWKKIAIFTLKNRLVILITLLVCTAIMGYFASKVQLSYEFTNAIPADNPKLKEYKEFKRIFGEDGNLLVIGLDAKTLNEPNKFKEYKKYCEQLQKQDGVDNVLSVPTAVVIYKVKTDTSEKLKSRPIFTNQDDSISSQLNLFYSLPFYSNLLYNANTQTHLVAVRLKKEIMFSAKRLEVVANVEKLTHEFGKVQNLEMHISGLPFVRSKMATDVKKEMQLFLLVSLLLTAVILFLFFRNISAVIFSLLTVLLGVVWAVGILVLLGYKITLLTALVPPLIIVIGIPNCIYFLNKYHQEYAKYGQQAKALVLMVQRMGIVTLFTNLTAAIGFGVFCFTKSQILQEFGWVAWLSIIVIFFISLFFIPAIFSYLAPPKTKHTDYLNSKSLLFVLRGLEQLVFKKRQLLYIVWGVALAIGIAGMFRLKSVGYMVDDLPKNGKIYQDLKYFEKNFKGVMPLEIWVDTKKKNGATSLGTLGKIDELSAAIAEMPQLGRPLSVVDAIKFARQAYYDGDSSSYGLPSGFDVAFLLPYLRANKEENGKGAQLNNILKSFVDSTKQTARISVSMADVGSAEMPKVIDAIQTKSYDIFDTARYDIKYTGTSIVFLEGSKFIINSLRDSIIYAFLMIFACMIFLFRNGRIVLFSILSNIIPIIITAGIMGWFGIALKPSTVLVFSVALGITVDVTIRFLVAFKQELPKYGNNIKAAVAATMHDTGMSIIYTSLILIAGFLVFVISQFDGTKALGYLTSITLLLAMFINLTILPALLVWMDKILLKKTIDDPLWEVLNEEEDIDLDKLKLE